MEINGVYTYIDAVFLHFQRLKSHVSKFSFFKINKTLKIFGLIKKYLNNISFKFHFIEQMQHSILIFALVVYIVFQWKKVKSQF